MRKRYKKQVVVNHPVAVSGVEYSLYAGKAGGMGSPNGGWAFVMLDSAGNKIKETSGNAKHTSLPRMELTAVLMGLREIPTGKTVRILSGSMYAVNSVNKWCRRWIANGWIRQTTKEGVDLPVANVDILQQLLTEIHRVKATAVWIKAHNGDKHNENADRMAEAEFRKLA